MVNGGTLAQPEIEADLLGELTPPFPFPSCLPSKQSKRQEKEKKRDQQKSELILVRDVCATD